MEKKIAKDEGLTHIDAAVGFDEGPQTPDTDRGNNPRETNGKDRVFVQIDDTVRMSISSNTWSINQSINIYSQPWW